MQGGSQGWLPYQVCKCSLGSDGQNAGAGHMGVPPRQLRSVTRPAPPLAQKLSSSYHLLGNVTTNQYFGHIVDVTFIFIVSSVVFGLRSV